MTRPWKRSAETRCGNADTAHPTSHRNSQQSCPCTCSGTSKARKATTPTITGAHGPTTGTIYAGKSFKRQRSWPTTSSTATQSGDTAASARENTRKHGQIQKGKSTNSFKNWGLGTTHQPAFSTRPAQYTRPRGCNSWAKNLCNMYHPSIWLYPMH